MQFYDDYPVIVMMQYEDLGLCAEGEGAEFVRAHTLDCDGTMPTNTSGGQLSMGQAGAAGGYLGLVETVRQLTDRPLGKARARREHRAGQRLRHDHLRPLPVHRCVDPWAGREWACVAFSVARGAGPRSPAHIAGHRLLCAQPLPRPHRPGSDGIQRTANGACAREPAPHALPPRLGVRIGHATVSGLQCGGGHPRAQAPFAVRWLGDPLGSVATR